MTARDLTDHVTAGGDHKMQGAARLAGSYRHEFKSLWTIPLEKANLRRYISCPLSLQFAFLLAYLSRRVLDLARKLISLPSYKTIQNNFGRQIGRLVAHLSDLVLVLIAFSIVGVTINFDFDLQILTRDMSLNISTGKFRR
jgi:hypothetical protein